MSAISFSDQLRNLEKSVSLFDAACKSALNQIPPDTERTIEKAEEKYKEIQSKFAFLSKSLEGSLHQISDRYYNGIDVFYDQDYLNTLELQAALNRANQIFIDHFVTDFPDVEIDYGTQCVSEKKQWNVKELEKDDAMAPLRLIYPNYRAIRGDGNCFFTSFVVGLLEQAVEKKQVAQLIDKILAYSHCKSRGTQVVLNLLMELNEYPSFLEQRLQNNNKILCWINFCRHIAADYIRSHPYDFIPFLEEGETLDHYIDNHVLLMGENAEHLSIQALCESLQFPIRIHDVGRDQNLEGTMIGYNGTAPIATLCRNGEHYFVLYKNDNSSLMPHQPAPSAAASSRSQPHLTQLLIQFTPPPGITIEMRGKGPGMDDWSVGIPLKKVEDGLWSWESDQVVNAFEYKIVGRTITNEIIWESGENRKMTMNQSDVIAPQLNINSASALTALLHIQSNTPSDTTLEIRGRGPGMQEWGQGLPLLHKEGNEWSFEIHEEFKPFEYKVVARKENGELIWEEGPNRIMQYGKIESIQPRL